MGQLLFLAAMLLCLVTKGANCETVSCYMSSAFDDVSGKLPSYAAHCYSSNRLCLKVYQNVTTFDKDGITPLSSQVRFTWNCANDIHDMTAYQLKCGDTFEITEAGRQRETNRHQAVYTRYCTCCGHLCNGEDMDESCNDQPLFTKSCYATVKADKLQNQKLGDTPSQVPCTQEQACFKKTDSELVAGIPQSWITTYQWGCSTPPGKQCGLSYTDNVQTRCTCCGDLCNSGTVFDGYNGNMTAEQCRNLPVTTTQLPTTAKPPPVTEAAPLTSTEMGLLISTCLLAVFLVVAIIATIIAMKRRNRHSAQIADKAKEIIQS